jgi:hypothetical protein
VLDQLHASVSHAITANSNELERRTRRDELPRYTRGVELT